MSSYNITQVKLQKFTRYGLLIITYGFLMMILLQQKYLKILHALSNVQLIKNSRIS